MIEIIPYSEFQTAIAPLWHAEHDPFSIPIYNNPYSVIEYSVLEQRDRILYFPIRFFEDGVIKGYSSIYNISDTILRYRGIYILPEHRGDGAGHRMIEEMLEMFPSNFRRVIGFMREETAERFIKHSDMAPVPNMELIWSDFSQVYIRCLYRDRSDGQCDDQFIERHHKTYGFGGRNNLNQTWTDQEWLEYITIHKGNYPDMGIDLSF